MKGEVKLYREFKWFLIMVKDEVFNDVEVMLNNTPVNERPPAPRLLDRSKVNGSQGPMEDGEMMLTIGMAGDEGAEIVTFIDGLYLQVLQEEVELDDKHFALTTPGFKVNTSPIFNISETWAELAEIEGYMMKVMSSSHTQRLESALVFNNTAQSKVDDNQIRSTSTSKENRIAEPSEKNMAECKSGT